MRQFINGQEYEIPVDRDGMIDSRVIRRAAGIPANRALIVKGPDGRNEIVNPGQNVPVAPGTHFQDIAVHKRG